MATAQEQIDAIDAELNRRGAAAAPAAPNPELGAIDAELRRRGALPSVPAPPVTQMGGAPVLPPVPPGSVPPPVVAPGTPPPPAGPPPEDTSHIMGAPGGPPITDAERFLWGNPVAADVTPDLTPQGPYTNQARAEGLQQARQQSFQQLVKPSGQSLHPPPAFAASPLEDQLQRMNHRLDAVSRQMGPQHQPVAGGPVDMLKRQQAAVGARLFAQIGPNGEGPLSQQVTAAMQEYNRQDQQLTARLKLWQDGKLPPAQAAQLAQDMHDHEVSRQQILKRRAQLFHYANSFMQTVQQYQGQPLHYGAYLPDEIAARQPGSLWAEFGKNLGQTRGGRALNWLNENMNPLGHVLAARPVVQQARQTAMLSGAYPPLPENPGRTPAERQQWDEQVRQVRRFFFTMNPGGGLDVKTGMAVPGAGFIPGPLDPGFDRYLAQQHLTPAQQAVVPVLKQQAIAENHAVGQGKVGVAAAKDYALWELMGAGSKFIGMPLKGQFGRLLAPLEARLEASTLNPLVRSAAKLGVRATASGAAHSTGAAVPGGLGGGLMAALEGQDFRHILESAREGAIQTAGIAGAMGAGGHLLSPRVTVRSPASEFYHNPSLAKPKTNDFLTLPDGTKFNLATASRAELEALHQNLPEGDPSRVLVEHRLFGPPGSHRIAEVTGRQHAARDLGAADIQDILQDYTTAEGQGPLTPAQQMNKAAVEEHAALANGHAERQRPALLRPEAAQEQRTRFAKAKVLGQSHAQTLDAAAGTLQGPKPGVAQVLREAAAAIKSDFQTDYRQNDEVNTGTRAAREANLPDPRRSAWRRLTPAERAALPENIRRILLLQDIHNSGTVIEPNVSSRSFVEDLGKRSTSWLAGEADRRFDQAETEFARGRQSAADVTLQQSATTGERVQQAQGQHGEAQGALQSALQQPGAPQTGTATSRVEATRQAVIDASRAHAEATAVDLQGRYVESLTRNGPDAPETQQLLNDYTQARDRAEALKQPVKVAEPQPEVKVEPPALEVAKAERQQRRGRRQPQQRQPLKKTAAPVPAPPSGPNPVEGFPKEKLTVDQVIQKVDAEGHPLGPRERIVKADNRTVTYTDSTTGQAVTQRLDKFMKSPFVPIEEGPQEGRKGGSAGNGEGQSEPSRVEQELNGTRRGTAEGEVGGSGRRGKEEGRKPGGKTQAHVMHQEAGHYYGSKSRSGQYLHGQARSLDAQVAPPTAKQRFLREVNYSVLGTGHAYDDTPSVRANRDNIKDAKTGRPLDVTGFRSESSTGRVPNTGTFYAAHPDLALRYSKWRTGAPKAVEGLTVHDFHFKRPFIVDGGHEQLVRDLSKRPEGLTPGERAAIREGRRLTGKADYKNVDFGYNVLDKAIAAALRRKGYDALVYRRRGIGASNHEFAVLGDVKASTVDNRQAPQNFPPGWEQTTMRGKAGPLAPGGEQGAKGGEVGRIPGGKTVAPELHEKAASAERRTARQVHYIVEEATQKLTAIGDALGFVRDSGERRRLLAEASGLRAEAQQAIRQEQMIGLAGAMKLRDRARALDDQINPALTAKQRFLRELEQVSPEQAGYAGPDRAARAPQTLTARLNTAAIQDARTGEPLQVTGFRSEARGGRIPGSGVFYSPYPEQAVEYSKRYGPQQSVKDLTVDALKFENPLVIGKSDAYDPNQHGHTEFGQYLWNRQREDPSLRPIAAAWVAAYRNLSKHGWRGYALLDKAMAIAARAAGHDALILRNNIASEVVDLRSRQPGTDVNGRPIRQPDATPGSAVSDWQHWGTNFPAGWEMNREKPIIDPEGEVGRKGGQKETGAANQMIDQAVADPQVAETFHRSRGVPDETPKDMKTATLNAGKTTLQSARHFVANFRNTIPDLVAREHPELHRMLLARIEGVANAADKAARLVDGAVRHLSPDERKLWEFRRWITDLSATSDKQWDAHQKNGGTAADFKAALPDGITRDWVKATETQFARHLAQQSQQNGIDILKLDAADKAVSAYRNAIVPHFDALYKSVNGVDLKLRDNIEHYMRHQILFLDNVLGGGGAGRHRIDANPRASHMQARSLSGTDLVHNTNWVESEMDWLPKMVRQIADLEIIKHLSDNYDVAPQMKLAHAEINQPGMIAALQGHAAGTKIAQAPLDVLAKMAAEHNLPDHLDGRFRGLLDSLLQLHSDNTRLRAANQPALHLSPEMNQRLGEYAQFLLESKNGQVSARSIVDDPSWQRRNKLASWQPIEGRHFYQAMTVPERMIQQALAGIDVYLDPATLKGVKAIGAKRRTMVLPERLAQVMEGYTPEEYKNPRNFLQRALDPLLTLWKWDKLYNPVHAGIYFLNNARSDYDAVFRGHTRAAGLIGIAKSAVELSRYMKTGEAGPLLTAWLDRGGMASTFVHQVGMAPRGLNILEKYGTSEVPRWKRNLTWAGNKYHNLMTMPHELREATLRYHNFKVWTDEMNANGGTPKVFGASDPTVVMGLKDIHDRAWELSNDLLGAYNKTSVGGQFLRKNAFPFWSWQEVLVHREVQMAKNAIFAPRIAAELGHQMTGGQATGVMAMAVGRYLAGLAAYGATTEMLNRLRFGANYRQMLPRELRGRTEPFMIWRHDPQSGQLLYLDKPTNFVDFADWLHLNRIPQYVEAVRKGRMQPLEVALDMLQGPRERLTQQLGPQFKLPAELSYQMADFPDPSRPHKVGQVEAIMRELSLDKAWKMVAGLPMPPPGRVPFFGHEFGGRTPLWTGPLAGQDMVHLLNTGVLDLGDTNYFEARADAQQWKARKLHASGLPGSETDEMHEAAYNLRKALRYGDRTSADQFLWLYGKLGGTDKSLKQSLFDMEPLHGLKAAEEARYLEQLAPDDRERLRSAYLHWANIVAPHTVGPADWDQPLKSFLLATRAKVMQHLKAEWGSSKKTAVGLKIDLGKSLEPAIEKVQKLDPEARETYLKGLSAEGAANLKQKYTAFAARAGVPDFAVPPRLALPDWIEAAQRQITAYRIKERVAANKEEKYRGTTTDLEAGEAEQKEK